ncbi:MULTISPECIES: DUF2771 family protein [Thermocrispum]|jgi:hypothetical protein|uniref:DUF2771 domain-containing protein n=1 Tax=Thermocrispum agreste TaxID=37925 RepID=A0A2W4JFP4_9PSEU|nr:MULTISPECIES: DUF2771 family protein [Thermocrispum]PZM97830.1 MAG: DUF2771 domain-containing protein [Thermocrispum agreste]
MPRRLPAVLLAALASTVAGCSASGPPELTVYADGKTMQLAPVQYCDVRVTECEANPQAAGLMTVRPDRPMQISVPPEVAESPWLVYVQSVDAQGRPQPVQHEFFSPGEAYAYTARPAPGQRLLTVEIQQAGAAFDDSGVIVARGVWSVQLRGR